MEVSGMNGRRHVNLEAHNAMKAFEKQAETEARKICSSVEGSELNWQMYLTKTSFGPFINAPKTPEPIV